MREKINRKERKEDKIQNKRRTGVIPKGRESNKEGRYAYARSAALRRERENGTPRVPAEKHVSGVTKKERIWEGLPRQIEK